MTVRDIIAEPLVAGGVAHGDEVDERVRDIARRCQLSLEHLRRYPHAFSGGQRQRIGIARALAVQPQFVVCDEPVSALDVSIQAQILNLLMDLQKEFGLTYLFVAHDLSVVEHVSDRVAVMYLGRLVEVAPTAALFYQPLHPYTEALMSAIPALDPDDVMKPIILKGEIPSPANPPTGCPFHPRCPYAQDVCKQDMPELREYRPGHFAACHFADQLSLKGAVKS
jgi:peptide/nickel transport system ATP-binding protein